MRQSHLIISNATIMWVAQVLRLVPQVIFVPYLIGTIGEVGYGVYALIWSLIVSIDQLQISLQQGVVRYSAYFLAQRRMDDVNKVVSSSFVYSVIIAVLGCVGFLIAAALYNDSSGQIEFSLFVVGILILFMVPLTPYIAVIQSKQRYYVGAIAKTASKYISLFAVIVWFHAIGPSVKSMIIIISCTLLLSKIAQVPVAYRLVPGLNNHPNLCNRKNLKMIVSFGGMVVLIGLCLMVNQTGIRWLMDFLASTSFVAHMVIILMPGLLLSQIIMAMSITIMPATSAYEATANYRKLQELLIRGTRYTTIIVLIVLLVAIIIMENMLRIWVGDNYAFLTPYALAILFSWAFMLSTSISHHMLKGLEKLRVVFFIYLLGLVIVPIGLIYAFMKIFRNPYISVTVGLAIGYFVCGCLNIFFSAKSVHVELKQILKQAFFQPFIVVVIIGGVSVCILASSDVDGILVRSIISIFAVLLFLCSFYIFFATINEKKQIKKYFSMALDKLATIKRKRSKS